jgi:DNA-binding beta-propeller fold protein YncE
MALHIIKIMEISLANSNNGTISVIGGLENTVISTIPLGTNNDLNDISYYVSNDRLFVTNSNLSTVFAIENQ